MKKWPVLWYVGWCDAQTLVDTWHSYGEVLEWAKKDDWVIRQAGYLLAETRKYIVLATKYDPQLDTEDQFAEITKIPKTWIRRRKKILTSS